MEGSLRKALLGLLLAWSGPASAADADGDGIANRKDACPDQAEVFNGHADDDGCPDELGILVVTVKDLHGEPVQGAAVSVGDSDKQTDPYGVATFPELLPGLTYAVRVDHSDFVDEDVQNVIPPEGRYEQVVTLDWKPVPIEVRAVEPRSGEALDAVVRMDGPGFVAPRRTGDDGEAVVLLRPGEWTLTVYADHHLQAKRSFELEPGAETVEARFELAPTWTGFADLALPFPEGSASVERALQETLDDLILELFAWPEVRLDVRGHPDRVLEELSAQRAGAVWAWLVQAGVPPGQVSVEALGASPLVPPGHPRAQELNRTVGFDVTVPDAPAQGGDADTDTDTDTDTGAPGDAGAAAIEGLRVAFEPGDAALDADDEAVLRGLVEVLAGHPDWSVVVQGRAGPSDAVLARQRAEAVRGYLVDRGVPGERLAARAAVDEPGARASLRLASRAARGMPGVLYFEAGDSQPVGASEPLLAELVQVLHTRPGLRVRLLGHSEAGEMGGEDPLLSRLRAQAVARSLEQAGVDPDRVDVLGLGAAHPALLPPGATEPALHRRVEVVLLPEPLLADLRIPFAPGAASVSEASEALERVTDALSRHPGVRLRVLGRAGLADGSEGPALALQRARAVVSALGLLGVDPARLEPRHAVDPGQAGVVAFEVMAVDEPRTVAFTAGSARLDAEGRAVVDAVARTLLAVPERPIAIVGRAGREARGSDGQADAATDTGAIADPAAHLARARAEAVLERLVRAGVAPHRVEVRTEVVEAEPAATRFEVR